MHCYYLFAFSLRFKSIWITLFKFNTIEELWKNFNLHDIGFQRNTVKHVKKVVIHTWYKQVPSQDRDFVSDVEIYFSIIWV